jgi:thioredoxin reductase (NADPH)
MSDSYHILPTKTHDAPKVAIIGSGPSGFTASIYTSRANIDTTVFMGMQPGGQLTTTTEIENFPGFPEGIDGGELMENMQKQAERFGSKMVRDEVKNIEIEYPKTRVLFATHNPSKVARLNQYVSVPNVELLSTQEFGVKSIEVDEHGKDEIENSQAKAKAFFDAYNIPSMALDTGLYFEGVSEDEQPKQNVQGTAGVEFGDSDEVRYQKMTDHYIVLANKYGGSLNGYFLDVYTLFDGKNYYTQSAKRPILLTNQVHNKDVHFPIASLYTVNGVYHHEMTDEQMAEYLQPSMGAVGTLLTDFLHIQKPTFHLEVSGENLSFDSVIIASGASAKYIGVEGEEKYIGKGYHSCATCDGFFYRKKEIIMVGGGDSAMEEANFLTRFATKVHLFHRSDKYRASKIMVERAKSNPKIEFHPFRQIIGFIGEEKVEGVVVENTQTKEQYKMPIDGVFVAIGHTPNTSFVADKLETDQKGYLASQSLLETQQRTNKYGSASKIAGIFIAGDVQDQVYRQAITAAGEGCKAAIDCERWLESL